MTDSTKMNTKLLPPEEVLNRAVHSRALNLNQYIFSILFMLEIAYMHTFVSFAFITWF